MPITFRFCPREIPLLAVGTKSDLRGRQNPPQEVTDILNIIRQQFNVSTLRTSNTLVKSGSGLILDRVQT
jgi:hypothetical protein